MEKHYSGKQVHELVNFEGKTDKKQIERKSHSSIDSHPHPFGTYVENTEEIKALFVSLTVSLCSAFLGAGVINFDGQGVISYRFKVLDSLP